jgi:rhamnulokinase
MNRAAFSSLALKYRYVFEKIEIIQEKPVDVIHIIGGGSQNALLCQLTADATGKLVIAGPVEATALGNALMQGVALGYLSSVEEGRQVIARSFQLKHYEPHHQREWDEAYAHLKILIDLNL